MGRRDKACDVFSSPHFKINTFGIYTFGDQINKFGCQFESFGNLKPRRCAPWPWRTLYCHVYISECQFAGRQGYYSQARDGHCKE